MLPQYSLDVEKSIEYIIEKKYSTIALQIPEGLKQSMNNIISYIEQKTKAQVIILADPCFGACDIPFFSLERLHVDCIIHIGHTPLALPNSESIPILYVNAYATIDVHRVVEKALSSLVGKRIGVATTAQHLHTLKIGINILEHHGFEPIVGRGDARLQGDGQILGCNFSSATAIKDKVDSYLFIGSGMFHPLGLLFVTKKPVIAADPYTLQVQKQELDECRDALMRQRYGAIALAKNAKNFGILVGLKPGQLRLKLSHHLKKIVESTHRHALLLAVNYVSPEVLQSFLDIDCFISTVCPRIAIDDYLRYKKPLLTPIELEIALGIKSWNTYTFDQIFTETPVQNLL